MKSTSRVLPLAAFALVAVPFGCGTSEESRAELATDKKPALVSVQEWSGQSACLSVEEVETPQQSQGDKGRKVTWSVCDARVKVVCESRASHGIIFASSRGEETVPQPSLCRVSLQGTMGSSKLVSEPVTFSHEHAFSPGASGTMAIPVGTSGHAVLATYGLPTTWSSMPRVSLSLQREGAAPLAPVSVPLTLSASR
jgi:hypothetical protein